MSKRLLMIGLLVCGALLQQLLPAVSLFGGGKPPVLAALVVHYALRREAPEMWTIAILAAVLHDGLELGSFGPALLAFPMIAKIVHHFRTELFADGLVTQLTFGALAAVFTVFVSMLVYLVSGQRPLVFGPTLLRLFGALWLGMITLPIVSQVVNRLEAALPKQRGYGWQ